MRLTEVAFSHLLAEIIDNRGRTCPTADEGIPLIATNCVRNELLYPSHEGIRFVSPETYATWFRGHPRPGDILFVNKGTPGRVCLVPDPVSFCIAQDMVALRPDPQRVYPRYLFAVLRAPLVQERIAQLHVGSLIPHFKKGDFNKLTLPMPSRTEQEFIGDAYFAICAKIDLNRQMSATLEAMARALFESWFVRFDPVRAKAEGRDTGLPADIAALFPDSFEQSEIGEVPKGWSPRQVEDVATLVKSTLTPEHFPNEVFAHFSIPAYDGDGRPSLERGDSIKSNKFCVPRHAVLLSKLNPFTPRVWLTDTSPDIRAIASTEFLVLTPKAPALRSWLYCGVTESEFVATLAQKAGGTSNSHQRVKPDDVMKSFIRPHGGDVIESLFARQVDPLLERISSHSREQSLLSATRDTLLPKLISGDLRVPDAERFLADAGV